MPSIADAMAHAHRTDALALFTVYQGASDFPDHVVVRMFLVRSSGESCSTSYAWTFNELQYARDVLGDHGLVPTARAQEDDSAIVETWL